MVLGAPATPPPWAGTGLQMAGGEEGFSGISHGDVTAIIMIDIENKSIHPSPDLQSLLPFLLFTSNPNICMHVMNS